MEKDPLERNKAYYADMFVTSRNREPCHTPVRGTFFDEESAESGCSGYAMNLDGIWKFQLFPEPEQCPPGFEQPGFDDSAWLDLAVPGNWQLDERVPDLPCYTNIAYPFPPDPPRLPRENPTGCYRRTFDVPGEWLARDVRLVFESVDSACQVWVNGHEAGYSEDSRLPAEFAVSKYLHPGSNLVAVKVFRYSTGSYLEDQDYWFMSGIQRSVRLLALSPVHLRDWRIRTLFDGRYEDAVLEVAAFLETRALPFAAPVPGGDACRPGYGAKLRLFDRTGKLVAESGVERFRLQSNMYGDAEQERDAALFRLAVRSPRKWSPEHPELYKLFLHLTDESGNTLEVQYAPVGFRQLEIRNRVVLLNGRRLIVRGVNRHEFSPVHGRAVTEEEMRSDIKRMKELNFNAVRTCHYPNCSRWYELCDEMGLCVVDEANLETHGLAAQLSKDPAWAAAYLERAVRMVLRDRNHPCVCFWSLGNESGCGPHHAAMANWIRQIDPTRPVQYESGNPGPLVTDIMVPMYPSLEWVEQVMADPAETRPVILCEYAYAKGNATGNFEEFWKMVRKYPPFQGGFIWDWADKAVFGICTADGRRHPGYGNDFGENVDYASIGEDATQVLNGITGADGALHPGAFEIMRCQAPVQFAFTDPVLTVRNEQHDSGMESFRLYWRIQRNGIPLAEHSGEFPEIAPGEAGEMRLDFTLPEGDGEFFLDLECRRPDGSLVTWDQFPLRSRPEKRWSAPLPVTVSEDETAVHIGMFHWSKQDGRFFCPDHLACPAEEIFFRAPTCNDRMLDRAESYYCDWKALVQPERRLLQFAWGRLSDGSVSVDTGCKIAGITSRIHWRVCSGRELYFEHFVTVPETFQTIPRIGLLLSLKSAERLAWFGRGPHENYPDRCRSARVGRYESTVSEMLEHYLVPGECGSRGDVRVLEIGPLTVEGAPLFRFSALHVSPRDLLENRHEWQLPHRAETFLSLDGFHCGLGGDTGWTRNVHEEYLLRPGTYRWGAVLKFDSTPAK